MASTHKKYPNLESSPMAWKASLVQGVITLSAMMLLFNPSSLFFTLTSSLAPTTGGSGAALPYAADASVSSTSWKCCMTNNVDKPLSATLRV